MSLSAFVGAARNVIEHVRDLAGGTMRTALLVPAQKRITLKARIENAHGLIDEELRRLKRGVVETDADKKAVAEFKKTTQV